MSEPPLAIIIEDDVEISRIFDLSLHGEFKIEIIADGNEALDRLQHVTPSVIILDLNLPGVGGGEILKTIRSDPRLMHIPVMLATADVVQAASLQDEADLVLVKPISPLQLRNLALRLKSMHE